MEVQERQTALEHLHASEARLLNLVEGLTPEQWTFHEAEDRWSIADIIEHIIAVERRITRAMEKMLAGPGQPRKPQAVLDSAVPAHVMNRTRKLTAPEPVRPVGTWPDTAELIAEFRKLREQTVLFVAETQADLRIYFIPHMAFGELDFYQWLLVLGRHGDRHAQQIERIKSDPAFPSAGSLVLMS